jgi:predicted dehydrogenase
MRVGVIGVGSVARYWIGAVLQNPQCRFTAACDQNPAIFQQLQRELGFSDVAFFASHHELLEADTVDCVIIATPPSSHHALVLDCLKNRYAFYYILRCSFTHCSCVSKFVVVEKPLAATQAAGQACFQLSKELNVPFYLGASFSDSESSFLFSDLVAYHSIFGAVYLAAKEIITSYLQAGVFLCKICFHVAYF